MKKNIIACFASFFVLVSGLMVLRATNGPDASPEGQLLKTLLQIMTLSSSADETVQVAIRQAAQSQMAMAKDAVFIRNSFSAERLCGRVAASVVPSNNHEGV